MENSCQETQGPEKQGKLGNLEYLIHRGAAEIGGTCIELRAGKTSILLDLGAPLADRPHPFGPSTLRPDALLVSHPHIDHYGRMEELPSGTPVYMSRLSRRLIDSLRVILGKPPLAGDIREFTSWRWFTVGDFRVKPYLVDHSSPDAFAFLVEGGGKRVFYSGDLRGHGRKGVLFDNLLKRPPRNIDLLFLEGTNLGRPEGEFPTEQAVERKIAEIIRHQDRISFLLCSSQNVDRLVSAYKACRRTGKTLVVDYYTAWILEVMKKEGFGTPAMEWDGVRVAEQEDRKAGIRKRMVIARDFFGDFPRRVDKRLLPISDLFKDPAGYLVVGRMSSIPLIQEFAQAGGVNLIYSMWKGYLEQKGAELAKKMAELVKDSRVNFCYSHTSGHAEEKDLKTVARAISPKALEIIHRQFEVQD